MKMNLKFSVIAVAACFAVFSASAGTTPAAKAPESAASSAVAAVATAHALVRYGDANQDALSLITAARIIKKTGSKDGAITRTSGQSGDSKGKPDTYAVGEVLARAKGYANGRADLIAMADSIANESSRGASNGPNIHRDVVRARQRDVYQVSFRGGESARVAVSGDYDTDLDLHVYDGRGNLVCSDTDTTDQAICGFTPSRTATYTIKVTNHGTISNAYALLTN